MRRDKIINALKDFAYGLFLLDPLMTIWRLRYNLDVYMMLLLYGDMLGLATYSPIYKLNLLKYFLKKIPRWIEDTAREKDITDKIRE